VRLDSVVAGNAGVEFIAAIVFDGDDVQGGVPVDALCCWGEGEAVDLGQRRWHCVAVLFWKG
jgi:hypothetical protein